MAKYAKSWNDKLNNYFIKLKLYFKNNWKYILINYLIFLIVFLILFIIDFAAKETLFVFDDGSKSFNGSTRGEFDVDSSKYTNFILFGIRSVGHVGVTFLPTKNIVFIQVLSIIFLLISIFCVLFTKNIFITVGLGIVAAGDFGNMLDRFLYNGMVKDILYIPWMDLGTFNFADIWLSLGCLFILFVTIFEIIQDKRRNKLLKNEGENDSFKNKNNQTYNNNLKMS
ncbi:signal peptidase II [Mycoplasma elephantis]|uniref:signal peptidase II n=1 Tax=Mycoplasma elephantis TaxID=114882 RepID=UPI000690A7DC|nr:signal peptidase II [Mycoplasma elephantis]